jgi:hypothetical protein
MTNRRVTAVNDSVFGFRTLAANASLEPLTVTLGAFVEAVTELTDDVDEIVAVIHHVLRTRAVPLGALNRRALIGVGGKVLAPESADHGDVPEAVELKD